MGRTILSVNHGTSHFLRSKWVLFSTANGQSSERGWTAILIPSILGLTRPKGRGERFSLWRNKRSGVPIFQWLASPWLMVCSFFVCTGSLSDGPKCQGCGPAERLRGQRPGGLLCRGPGDVVRTFFGGKWVENLWFTMGIYRFYRFYMGDLISTIDMRMSGVSFR